MSLDKKQWNHWILAENNLCGQHTLNNTKHIFFSGFANTMLFISQSKQQLRIFTGRVLLTYFISQAKTCNLFSLVNTRPYVRLLTTNTFNKLTSRRGNRKWVFKCGTHFCSTLIHCLKPCMYKMIQFSCRQNKRGGGLATIFSNDFTCSKCCFGDSSSFEYLTVTIYVSTP